MVSDTLNRGPDIEDSGQATDPHSTHDQIKAVSPGVITLDIEMPCMGGLTFLRLLMQYFCWPAIVMSSVTVAVSSPALNALRPGAPTGDTEAWGEVLTHRPVRLPPPVFVQGIPAAFSRAFADRLDPAPGINEREAVDRDLSPPRNASIARGNFHLGRLWFGKGDRVDLRTGSQVWHQSPPVDVLFKSLPPGRSPPASALTRMVRDRAQDKGTIPFTRGEVFGIAYGMPSQAKEFGDADHRVSNDRVASCVLPLCYQPVRGCSHVPA